MTGRALTITLLAGFMALFAGPAVAERLIAALSTPLVIIDSEFTGSDISLFGVIERDAQTISRPGPYQVIATVSGPVEDVLVQRKERRFGIWVNGSGHLFTDMPSYYAIYATESAQSLLAPDGSAERLSVHMLGHLGAAREPYRKALEQAWLESGQFRETVGSMDLLTKTFFRAIIRLPAIAEAGVYNVRVHLFADGVQLSTVNTNFALRKAGFGAQLWAISRQQPLFYGLGTVALALVTGYIGGVVFRRG